MKPKRDWFDPFSDLWLLLAVVLGILMSVIIQLDPQVDLHNWRIYGRLFK